MKKYWVLPVRPVPPRLCGIVIHLHPPSATVSPRQVLSIQHQENMKVFTYKSPKKEWQTDLGMPCICRCYLTAQHTRSARTYEVCHHRDQPLHLPHAGKLLSWTWSGLAPRAVLPSTLAPPLGPSGELSTSSGLLLLASISVELGSRVTESRLEVFCSRLPEFKLTMALSFINHL